jgi:apolipoprotein N-acyltransferase
VPRLRLSARPRLPSALGLSIASGLALSLAFPPAGLWPLAFVALAPLLWLLRAASARRGLLLGLAFGVSFYGATLGWILRFGLLGWTGLTLLSGLSVGVFAALAPWWIRSGRPIRTALGLAALWTVVDFARAAWPLGGFTWGSLGVSQVDDRALLRLASVAGVWGVTFVVAAVNALLVETVAGPAGLTRRAGRAGLAAAIVLAPLAVAFPVASGRRLDVATIQTDVRQAERGSLVDEDLAVARLHIDLHASLRGAPPDLAVWGEGALDPAAAADAEAVASVREAIAAVGAPTLVGAVLNDPDGRQRTSVVAFDGAGRMVDRYDKTHLVPFGEYVPFRSRLEWIRALEQVPIDRAPGERAHAVLVPDLPPIGTPICFENSFPALPRALVNDGAELLVVPVNNASYGFSAASEQHLQMSRIRAVETGRWIVNAAVSGVSAFIDPSGRIISRAELFEPAILRSSVWASSERTWFVRLGSWFPWASLVLLLGLFLSPRRRSGAARATAPVPERPRTLVILPTYMECETVERVVRGVLAVSEDVHALVVDDASPDGTADIVRGIAAADPRVRLRERPAKSGLAGAYVEGFGMAIDEGFDVAVEMDSDLSHDPADLARVLDGARSHDLTIGSRYVAGGSVTNWSTARVALSRAGNVYARFMLGFPVHDATSGYRAYRRELLRELMAEPFVADGYGFQIELASRAWQRGFDVGEVPITFREREHGHSKISRRIVVEALWLVTKWGLAMRMNSPEPRGADRDADRDAEGPATR